MNFRVCKKCAESKPDSAFYADRNECKDCKKKQVLENKKATGDYANRQHRKRYPERERARNMVRNAIRSGTLVKQPCFCGDPKTVAHHDYYKHPLLVRWLCNFHHSQFHRNWKHK